MLKSTAPTPFLSISEDLFPDLEEKWISDIINSGTKRAFNSNQIIFRQGDHALRSYLIVSGHVKLTKLHEDGREAVIRYIGPGQLTAAAILLNKNEYPLTAEAITATEVISWDKQIFLELMKQYPQLTINLLRLVLERLEEVQQRFLEMSAEQVERRIARAILRIMGHAGKKTDEGVMIDFPLGGDDLANVTGTTHFTVSRVLSSWKRKGWIKSGQRITITDAHALVMFAEQRQE